MKPILKNLDTNFGFSIEELYLRDGQMFANWLNACIGAKELKGTNDFQIFVCTLDWLEAEKDKKNPLPEKYLAVAGMCSAEKIEDAVRSFVCSCEADSWPEIVHLISLRANWEYEGYSD